MKTTEEKLEVALEALADIRKHNEDSYIEAIAYDAMEEINDTDPEKLQCDTCKGWFDPEKEEIGEDHNPMDPCDVVTTCITCYEERIEKHVRREE